MKNKFENQDQIDRYLLGKMSQSEQSEFLITLKSDPILQREFEFTKATKEALQQNSLKVNFKTWDKEAEKKTGLKIDARRVLAFAASIALLFFAFTMTKNYFEKNDFETYLAEVGTAYPMTNVSRGEGNAESNIDGLYVGQNYKEVIPLLQDSKNEDAQFYLGNAQYQIGEYNLAEKSFTTYLSQIQPIYKNQANWYLALCYIHQGQIDQANTLLDLLKKGNSSYSKRAEELSTRLTNR